MCMVTTTTATTKTTYIDDSYVYSKFLQQLFTEIHLDDNESLLNLILAAMSTAFLTAIAVILCILFRLLNVNSQPLKPSLWCLDETFLDCIYKIAPILRDP